MLTRNCLLLTLILFSCGLTLTCLAQSSADKIFRVAVYNVMPSEPFTGYHALRNYIAKRAGYQIEFIVVPAKRMPYALGSQYVDAISVSGLARETRNHIKNDGYLQAQYPDRVVPVDIYFKENAAWQPDWPANKKFKTDVRGASINYNYLSLRGFNLIQIPSYSSGTLMVNFGRADYWIDTIPDSSPSFSRYRNTVTEGYVKKKLFDSPLYMLFADNARGRTFKTAFDKGMANLLSNPRIFMEVYLPDGNPRRKPGMMAYLRYMRESFPEFGSIDYTVLQ